MKGWRTGTDWLNSATLLARNNFAETVAMGDVEQGASRPPRQPASMQFAEPTAPQRPKSAVRPAAAGREARPRAR